MLQGLTCCIWSQGINDFSANTGASASSVISAVAATIAHARTIAPHVKFIGCTVASALGSTCQGHGGVEQDTERKAFNDWLRSGSAPFDKILDFDAVRVLPVAICVKRSHVAAAAYLPGNWTAAARVRLQHICKLGIHNLKPLVINVRADWRCRRRSAPEQDRFCSNGRCRCRRAA